MWLSWAWNSSLSTSNLAWGCCWDKLNCHGHQCQTFSRSRMFSIYFNHSKVKLFTWQRYSQTMTLNIGNIEYSEKLKRIHVCITFFPLRQSVDQEGGWEVITIQVCHWGAYTQYDLLMNITYLVGGLEHEFYEFYEILFSWEFHHPNWWTLSFSEG